ncbi:MAG: biotin/lipoyl-containing protein [Chloroflexota bacterium]|nr:biotin/lipoyl-containing protein [Chloroflexota bacterium]
MKYAVTVKDQTFTIEVMPDERVRVGDHTHTVDLQSINDGFLYSLLIDNNSYEALIEEQEGKYQVLLLGELYTVQVEDALRSQITRRRRARARPSGRMGIKAPMPGLVIDVPVSEGQEVFAGDVLVILESMKMENEVRAPRDGRVNRVQVGPSDTVEKGQILVVLE